MNQLKIAKVLVSILASASVGAVVGNVVKVSTPANVSPVNKVLTSVGGYILSTMISEKASEYAVNAIFGPETEEEAPKEAIDAKNVEDPGFVKKI